MIDTVKKIVYKAFGLSISSDIPLSELPQTNTEEKLADIFIRYANLSEIWSDLSEGNRYFVVKKDFVLFHIPDIAIFLIQKGKEILVSPIDGFKEDQIRLYVLGTCMGALLMQREVLPLHGSALMIDGKAYAIVGNSGAGKSTLASVFLKRGYRLLSDDVIPVTLREDNLPIVTPAYPQQKLWIESLDQFGMDSRSFRPIFNRETKFAVPVPEQFATEPVPLAGVFELNKTDNDEIEIHPIKNLGKLHTLFNHTYRNFLINRLGLLEWHFSTTASIVNQIILYQIKRPDSYFSANELADLILNKIGEGEEVT
ncbi:aldolase [Virgibacillus phasianinus]|uniref:Aldolase n=1 Tax=Virgibacillus phasianinus TaxID=2017483 RepID=A0A220U788_9BACI|nr:aldolase [Virgibacillus phasianinus]ASK63711.1 aldolase [Virgibacillus phasianinus]